jgi:flagellar basal body-associated protein FliL
MRKNSRFGLMLALCLTMAPLSASWANEEAAAAKPSGDAPIFVKINPINIPVIRKNGTTSVLALDIIAEVKNDKDREKVEAIRPKLRDTFIRALYGSLETNKLVTSDGILDIERVKSRLMKSSLYVMKEPMITDLLLNGVNHRAF